MTVQLPSAQFAVRMRTPAPLLAYLGAPGCTHRFHLTCIQSWACIDNSCSACKGGFTRLANLQLIAQTAATWTVRVAVELDIPPRKQVCAPSAGDLLAIGLAEQEVCHGVCA